jgi:hypothetical protein
MQSDDRPSSDPPEVQVATVDDTGTADLVAVPVLPQPGTLVEVFRLLQQRIPGFTHLSLQEQRSMARAAHLDPEFLEEGITTACAAGPEDARTLTRGMTGEECRALSDEIRHGEEVYREAMVLAKGIASTNLQRKHRLGRAILSLYSRLGLFVDDSESQYRHLRPYFERMKRAYMKGRKTRQKAKAEEPETPPA